MNNHNHDLQKNDEQKQATSEAPMQLLTFLLDQEIYATDINQIQEVLEYRKITIVPKQPVKACENIRHNGCVSVPNMGARVHIINGGGDIKRLCVHYRLLSRNHCRKSLQALFITVIQ